MKASFKKRPPGRIPHICGHQTPGQLLREEIENGDCVSLRLDEERVEVNEVEILGKGKFRGRINGFQNCELQYQGYMIEETVDFDEAHIFILHLP